MFPIRRALPAALMACLAVMSSACQNAPAAATTQATPLPTFTLPAVVRITPTPEAPAPSAEPTASPTPTRDTRLITTFGPDVDPLTGEQVDDPTVLHRRPLAIKVANSTETGVRPQAGVSFADLVFEHEAEGGITRWTAIFLSRSPARVGSNRSCRIIDADLPAMYKALLACSGFSGGTREYYIKPTEFFKEGRAYSPDFGDSAPLFFRTESAFPPHNLFVDPEAVWNQASRDGVNQPQDLTGMVFSPSPLDPGSPANVVRIPYGGERAEWRYDPGAMTCSRVGGCYLRWSDGAIHTDALNGQQLSAANVVIVYVNHVFDTRYFEDVALGGHYSIQIQIWNDPANPDRPGGRAQVARDGQVFEGHWSRPGRFDMISILDADGEPIPLKPGLTWFQVVRPDTAVTIQP